jgi:conjugative transfer pilus assembly protein TraH
VALLLVLSPLPLHAGDLNTEVNNMFNNLGAIGNYTAPGAFRGQTFNTYTGGKPDDALARTRSTSSPPSSSPAPRPAAAASTSSAAPSPTSRRRVQEHAAQHHRRAARHRLPAGARVGLAAAGRADQVGQGAGDLDQQRPHQLLRDRQGHRQHGRRGVGYSSQETCADLAIEMGLESDRDAARRRCAPTAQHPGLGPFLSGDPTCATRPPSSAT